MYEFIRIFKNCAWCWSLKLHSWIWIELGFVRSLISVFFDRTRKDSFQFLFICYTLFLYVFSFFINCENTYGSYCRILCLVHSHFIWKILTLLYKVVTIFSCFSLEISLLFQFKKRRFCLFQLGKDHISKCLLLFGIYSMFQMNWASLSLPYVGGIPLKWKWNFALPYCMVLLLCPHLMHSPDHSR